MAETSRKKRLVRGVVWSAIDNFSGLFVQMICSLVIARLLTPADFGIVGMITVFSAIGLIIIDSGFGQALIRKQDANNTDYNSVFYFNIFISLVVYGILYFCSPFIERFYGIENLCTISRVIFLIIPINAIGLIQNTILTKHTDFKRLCKVSFFSAIISGIIGITLAYIYRSVWALVIQSLSMYACRSLFLWIEGTWSPKLTFSIASIKGMLSYSMNLMFTGLFGTIVNNICPLVIGKLYDAKQLGFFSQADRLQKLPSTTVTNVIQRVTFPILSELQDDNKRLVEGYFKIISIAAFFISPLMMYLIVEAKPIFNLLLGEKWLTAATYFQILCVTGLFYPMNSLSLNLLNVKGKAKLLFRLEVLRKVVFATIILISMHFDIIIFVWMQVAYTMVQLFINLYFSGRVVEISLWDQLRAFLPELTIAALSSFPCLIISYCVNLPDIISILLMFAVYLATYIMISKLIGRTSFRESLTILMNFTHTKV